MRDEELAIKSARIWASKKPIMIAILSQKGVPSRDQQFFVYQFILTTWTMINRHDSRALRLMTAYDLVNAIVTVADDDSQGGLYTIRIRCFGRKYPQAMPFLITKLEMDAIRYYFCHVRHIWVQPLKLLEERALANTEDKGEEWTHFVFYNSRGSRDALNFCKSIEKFTKIVTSEKTTALKTSKKRSCEDIGSENASPQEKKCKKTRFIRQKDMVWITPSEAKNIMWKEDSTETPIERTSLAVEEIFKEFLPTNVNSVIPTKSHCSSIIGAHGVKDAKQATRLGRLAFDSLRFKLLQKRVPHTLEHYKYHNHRPSEDEISIFCADQGYVEN